MEVQNTHNHDANCGCKNEKGAPLFVDAPTAQTMKALQYADQHIKDELNTLKNMVKIPSVSLKTFDEKEVRNSATATAEHFQKIGLENIEVLDMGAGSLPFVYADWMHKPDAPTLLLYAHHDVQPPGRLEKWDSDPFVPTERGGRLYGRGTADDKAGILAHTAAIAAFLKTSGELPVNVKLLIDGEEEIGSTNLGPFARKFRDKIKADGLIVTDCANVDTGIPSLTTSLRGIVAMDIEIEALEHPVHSGLWGGILPDAVSALSKILATLMDDRGNMLVAGIYDDVLPLTDLEKKSFENLKMGEIARKATGLLSQMPFTVPEEEFAKHLWKYPAMSINAIQSGSRKLVSNIVQDGAWARISVRTVPNMKPQDVVNKIKAHIQSVCPAGYRLKVETEATGDWWKLEDPNSQAFEIAARSLEKGYGHSAQIVGCGGSIPFVQPLTDELSGIPAILVGVEDPYTKAHSENESLHLGDFKKSILGQIHMLADMAKYQRK